MADRSGGRVAPAPPVAPLQPWQEGWGPHDPWEAADYNPLAPTAATEAMTGGGFLAMQQALQQAIAEGAEPWLTGLSYLDALDDPMRNNLALLQFFADEARRSGQYPWLSPEGEIQGASGQTINEALQQIYPGFDLQGALDALAVTADPLGATHQRMLENSAAGEPFQPVTTFGDTNDLLMALATMRLSPGGLIDDALGFIPFLRITKKVAPHAAEVIEEAATTGSRRGVEGFGRLLEEADIGAKIAPYSDGSGFNGLIQSGEASLDFNVRGGFGAREPAIYVNWLGNEGAIGSTEFQRVMFPFLDAADAAGVRVMAMVDSGTERASHRRLEDMYNRMGFVRDPNTGYIVREPVPFDDATRGAEHAARLDPRLQGVRANERGTSIAPSTQAPAPLPLQPPRRSYVGDVEAINLAYPEPRTPDQQRAYLRALQDALVFHFR